MKSVIVHPPSQPIRAEIRLASSKSESNRALIINALTQFKGQLENLSTARDTQTMMRLLQSPEMVADVLDAGTTMRFLTAYFAVTGQHKIMTGTPRMCERPIGILVDALRVLGATVTYRQKEGYPPMELNGFQYSGQNRVQIRGDVSSQYISALLMVGPLLPEGITLELTGDIGSRPYIEMTLQQMIAFGVTHEADWETKTIHVPAQQYTPTQYAVESDWSGASYWYSLVALAQDAEVELLGLKENSLQGDSAIVQIMERMGVKSVYTKRGVLLTKIPAEKAFAWDFTDCPDLAQTVAACAVAAGIEVTMTGIESLKIKETDRVGALQAELPKIGGELVELEPNHTYIVRRKMEINTDALTLPVIETYDDHRMAMAFAPVGMAAPIKISEPHVVAKSYPSFWEDLKKVTAVD
ncbi:3-phosphoshikimate 1-carboxyvinyltransferase [Runella slithyformis]|uniref:3-phosphoshikimate 1-carboxyvinyltransferase n=1 Tax=Runella slithyformis (strain ATCC 29530 / DSM 19594 / LMG 11500 / NCIMB 11436 / LSU 4) TaxID=761193 RepID=A0A7U3ZKV1_RUNSL|nr:3-phosphoshikimate 1-carboxyvinyltransferase [Runella slithyformis]AEI49058.1 3-phosphoshikimate 1-carboxyvinyltransferase [Runella slithyformis DSM 19594]